ncbi:hypothetical protein [Pseudomonas phage PH826]|nr:hypothetical protein [Pseudomonas phage PH826]
MSLECQALCQDFSSPTWHALCYACAFLYLALPEQFLKKGVDF